MTAKILDAVTATGAGSSWQVRSGATEHTLQLTCTGSPTSVAVIFEGSLDGSTWFPLAVHIWDSTEIANQAAMFHISSKFITYMRANVTTLTGGTSPTLTCLYDWEE